MAGDVTIDDYLAALRRALRGHPDRDATLDEVEDHLRSTVERLVTQGRAADEAEAEAEAETILAFGDPDAIAVALLAANGAAAAPTAFTQRIGRTTVVASVAWAVLGAGFWSSHLLEEGGRSWEGLPRLAFMVGMVGLAGAAFCTLLLALALRQRLGGFGTLATLGIGVTGLAVASSVVAWAVVLWTALLTAGCLPVAAAVMRDGTAPTGSTLAFGAAWPLGLGTFLALQAAEVGQRDEWGNYPMAALGGISVGCAIMFVAFVGLGRWLGSEEPVDLDLTPRSSIPA